MLTITLRKAIVIPTALTLALGGALLVSAPANAAALTVAPYTTQSPTYEVSFHGTATPDDTVVLEDGTGATIATTTAVDDGSGAGVWTLTHQFDNTDALAQNLSVVDDPAGPATEIVATPVTLPSLTIATPTSVVAGSPIAVTGTAPVGAQNVTVSDANSGLSATATVAANGDWTATVDEPAGSTTDTLSAVGATSAGEVLNTATTPAFAVAPAPSTLTVTKPTSGFVATRRTVTFSGTGTAGDEIDLEASGAPGDPVTVTVGADGTWTADLFFEPADPNAETVTVTQPADGGSIVVTVTLPTPPVVLAPVIVKPGAGSSSTSETVTYTGTSQPGTYVQVLAVPTVIYHVLIGDATAAQTAAANALPPIDYLPTSPVKVDAAGNWTVSETLTVGDWTAIAVDEANADASPVTTDSIADNSAASDPREFVITAPVAVTAASTGTTAATLAFTGSNDGPEIALAALLLLGGAALVATNAVRRRRARS